MSKKPKPKKERNIEGLIDEAERIRREMDDKVFRRKDGVLQCPTAYADGYGIQDAKYTL